MRVVEYGKENQDVIMLLHGGGLAPWNYKEEAKLLEDKFHILVPVLDGHSGSDHEFISIEENARKLIQYIDEAYGGQVLLIGGLSLGGQILVEMLSQREAVCRFAIIESALAMPMKITASLIKSCFPLCYPLIKKRWFAKLQFNSLHIKQPLFEDYFKDSANIGKEDMVAFLQANSDYKIKNTLSSCQSKTLVLAGGKEQRIMKKSAELISKNISDSTFEILPEYCHGDLSLNHSEKYTEKLLRFIGKI